MRNYIDIDLNLQVASKIYKKTLKAAFEKHKKALCDKIRKLKSSNLMDYWALLKNCNKKQNESDQLNIDTFYEHFSNLNTNRHTETVSLDELISDRNIDPNPLLNSDFTYDEVQKAIVKLKNNKRPL